MKAALIGAGQIARQHLACLETLPGVEVAAICDLSAATAEAAAERCGIPAWFTDHRAMLAKVRRDVAHVTTPPASQFRLAMDALDADAHNTISKWWQERVTRRFAEAHDWDVTVFRPGFVRGRDHGYLAALGQPFGRHHLGHRIADPHVVDGLGERIWTYPADDMRGSVGRGWRCRCPIGLPFRQCGRPFATVFRNAGKVPSILIPRRLVLGSQLKPLRFENRRLRGTPGWTPPLDYRTVWCGSTVRQTRR